MEINQSLLAAEKAWVDGSTFLVKSAAFKFKIKATVAFDSIQKLKELLGAVHNLSTDDWRDLDTAARMLPKWFLEKSPAQMSADETELWLKKWRGASTDVKSEMQKNKGWSPADWLFWMNPKTRLFFIVDYLLAEECFLFASSEWSAPTGAAKWMLKMTGHTTENE